jgi:hypothetical protein
MRWAPQYADLLARTTPFLVSHRSNWASLNLAPLGVEIPPAYRFDPTRLSSRGLIDGLHRLDRFSFGPQEMLMPRWVLFDCGEFPGVVFGLGCPAHKLPVAVQAAYHVEQTPEAFVPLSMWVAIRCAAPDAWFGHNLSSANLVMQHRPMPGLGTLTKGLGIAVTQAKRQCGATQWRSRSLHVHLTFGQMQLLSAYTPAHTHPSTFTYEIAVDPARLSGCLSEGWQRPAWAEALRFEADDEPTIRSLHEGIEAGEPWHLAWAEAQAGRAQTIIVGRG